MSSPNISGSIKSLTLKGVTYSVMADANVTETISEYENDAVATSGLPMRKMTKRITKKEGITIACNADQLAVVKALADAIDNFTITLTYASGETASASGFIEVENRETETNKATVKVFNVTEWAIV